MTSWQRGRFYEYHGQHGGPAMNAIDPDPTGPDLLIRGADKAEIWFGVNARSFLRIPISVKECQVCGGSGEVYWMDTEAVHGCGGDEKLCAEICPVPVGVQGHAPCPNPLCIGGFVPADKEDEDE